MRRIKRTKPSAALIVAVVALVAALGGGAVAGVAVTSLNKKETKKVRKIAKKQAKKLDKKIELTPGQITSNSIDDSKLTDLDLFGDAFVTAPVSDQTDKEFGPGQVAAPKVPLFSKGQLSVYGKCFETQTPETYATVSVETSAPGAILGATDTPDPEPSPPGSSSAFKTRTAWLDGDPEFLDPDTDELDRTVGLASVGSGSFQSKDLTRASFTAMSPDGTAINGLMSMAVGTGGIFGSGTGCLFSGFGIG